MNKDKEYSRGNCDVDDKKESENKEKDALLTPAHVAL